MDIEASFKEFLDEAFEPYQICDAYVMPSEILEKCDPIAYREALNAYEDSLIKEGVIADAR